MTRIRIKRVYEPAEAGDGYRVLVDRLWPRGMRRDEVLYDLWAKEIAPEPALRSWYHADPEARWPKFAQRYAAALQSSEAARRFAEVVRGKSVVTLLYAAKDATHNHALILQEYLRHALAEAVAGQGVTNP